MAIIVIFDELSSPNKILDVLPSASTDQFLGRTDVLFNPDLSAVEDLPRKYWKQDSGVVVEMTAQEQSDVDAAEAALLIQTMRGDGKAIINAGDGYGVIQRAVADIVKDEINMLRQWLVSFKVEVAAATNLANLQARVATLPNLPDRTLLQLRNAIQARIDSGNVDS